MTVIYGLREIGSEEIRYVGRTEHALHKRLHKHKLNVRQGYPPRICAWIESAQEIEIIPLRTCAKERACAVERETVTVLFEQGHRLTNSHLLPRKSDEAA